MNPYQQMHHSKPKLLCGNNSDEFYKYLGIDTKRSQEKSAPMLSRFKCIVQSSAIITYIFIQHTQTEFPRINEKLSKSPSDGDEFSKRKPSTKLNGESDQRNWTNVFKW